MTFLFSRIQSTWTPLITHPTSISIWLSDYLFLSSLVLMILPSYLYLGRSQLTDRPQALLGLWQIHPRLAAQVIFLKQICPCHTMAETHWWIPTVWRIKWKSIAWPTWVSWVQLLTCSSVPQLTLPRTVTWPPLLLWTRQTPSSFWWCSFLATSISQFIFTL